MEATGLEVPEEDSSEEDTEQWVVLLPSKEDMGRTNSATKTDTVHQTREEILTGALQRVAIRTLQSVSPVVLQEQVDMVAWVLPAAMVQMRIETPCLEVLKIGFNNGTRMGRQAISTTAGLTPRNQEAMEPTATDN